MHSVKNLLIYQARGAAAVVMCAACLSAAAQSVRDVTGANGIVYEVLDADAHTVAVSAINQSKFQGLSERRDLTVPATVEDAGTNSIYSGITFTVTAMKGDAFKGCAMLNSVMIEAAIPEIPANAFSGCTGLTAVAFPATVTKIGNNAFSECSSLVSVGDISNVTFIDGYAFEKCASITSITLPEGLSVLNARAFAQCTSLQKVNLPSSLKSTSAGVFAGCTALAEVTVAQGVESLGNELFAGCTSLMAPEFPASLKNIGNSAFHGCTSLGELTLPAGVVLGSSSFEGSHITALNLPEAGCTLNLMTFKQVTGLRELSVPGATGTVPADCFTECPSLQTVALGQGISEVGVSAFKDCPELQSLTLAESVMEIGRQAFAGCARLSGVKFPAVMTLIDEQAFENCRSLGDLALPAGAALGNFCFHNTNLTSITWPHDPMGAISTPFGEQNGISEMSFPGWMVEIPERICTGWQNLRTVNLSEGIESVGAGAFSKSAVTTVAFPSTMRTVCSSAFDGCASLTSLSLNDGLASVEENAFNGCAALTSLSLPGSLRAVGKSAFAECTSLQTVDIASGPSAVAESLFSGCTSLTTVTLPETVETISESAFYNCSSLNSVKFPAALKSLGRMAFARCGSFGPVTLTAGMTVGEDAFNSAGVTAINFPAEECYFEKNAFNGNSLIEKITFPTWMTVIPEGFCMDWSKLEEITFSGAVTEISASAFYKCSMLHDVTFPPTVTKIGTQAFKLCNRTYNGVRFGEVHLGADVEIGDEAFAQSTVTAIIFDGCATFDKDVFAGVSSIVEFTFPECMTEIPDGFCRNWSSLVKVSLPDTLKKIGAHVFDGCSQLTTVKVSFTAGNDGEDTSGELPTVEFPAGLESIGAYAFINTKISSVTLPTDRVEIGEGAFASTQITSMEIPAWMDSVPDYFLSGCGYLTSLTWEARTGEEAAPAVHVGAYAFQNCQALTQLNMPDVDVTLGQGCFYNCNKAVTINWASDPAVKVVLGSNAFENCSKLTGITLPASATEIPNNCFKNCFALGRFDIGAGVRSIGMGSFYGAGLSEFVWNDVISSLGNQAFVNTTLESIEIPPTIAEIPYQCFLNNRQLRSVTFNEGLSTIGQAAFYNCPLLEAVEIPASVSIIETSAFYECKALAAVTLHDGLAKIGETAFGYTSALKEITLPSTLSVVENKAFTYSGIEHIESKAENLKLGNSVFENCSALKTFSAIGHIEKIGTFCFQNVRTLTDFTLETPGDYVGEIQSMAFYNCSALKAVPALTHTELGNNAFTGCTSLVAVTLPEDGSFCTTSSEDSYLHIRDYLNGATSLQSLVYPYTGPHFGIKANDIANAPLKGISYSYASDIVPLGEHGATILKYDGPEVTDKAKLYVKRGQKWKYIDAGYGKRFDIEEMKEPDMTVEGDIFSEYIHSEGRNYNHYTASLRWEVNLSDLNAHEPTYVDVYIDDNPEPIAEVCFKAPVIGADETTVDVTVNGEPTRFESNFIFPNTDASGQTLYVMSYATQEPTIKFDTNSSKRKDAIDYYGYKSWFMLVYEFDEDLEQPSVPSVYRFHARMRGYGYSRLVNNADCAADADGCRYTSEPAVVADSYAEPCSISIAVAEPSLEFDGLYTTAQIMADTDRHLYVTKPWVNGDNRTYSVTYSLDPALMNERGYKYGSSAGYQYIINKMVAKQVIDDETLKDVGESTSPSRTGEGAVMIERQHIPQPGYRYQIITSSDFRGTFGSAVIEIPDAPTLTALMTLAPTRHISEALHLHEKATFDATLYLYPDVSAMGYDDNFPQEGSYHVGLWRTVNAYDRDASVSLMAMADGDGEANSEVLLHHTDGLTNNGVALCSTCAENAIGVTHDSENNEIRYNDVMDVEVLKMFDVSYTPRLYVKVPSSKLRSGDRWMVADATVSQRNIDSLTGIEDVSADAQGESLWYDLQGRPVLQPVPGQTYIRVTRRGASKVIKMPGL